MTNPSRPDGAVEDYTKFTLGVEAVIQLTGAVSTIPESWGPAIVTGVAAATAVPEADVEVQFLAGFAGTTHVWIRAKGLDGTLEVNGQPQEQQVKANLTEVIGDTINAQKWLKKIVSAGAAGAARMLSARAEGRALSEAACAVEEEIAAQEAAAGAGAGAKGAGARSLSVSGADGRSLSEAAALCVELVAVPPVAMCFPEAVSRKRRPQTQRHLPMLLLRKLTARVVIVPYSLARQLSLRRAPVARRFWVRSDAIELIFRFPSPQPL